MAVESKTIKTHRFHEFMEEYDSLREKGFVRNPSSTKFTGVQFFVTMNRTVDDVVEVKEAVVDKEVADGVYKAEKQQKPIREIPEYNPEPLRSVEESKPVTVKTTRKQTK